MRGPLVLTDDPPVVYRWTACTACGTKRRFRADKIPTYCPACGAGARRADRQGESKSLLYKTWRSMIHRCGTTCGVRTRRRYHDRGIYVCAEWLGSFVAFRDWCLSNGYASGLTLDRRDNDGPYAPDNCRWITARRNSLNQERTVRVTAWSETRPLMDWMADDRVVVGYFTAWDRLRAGWEPERALATPVRQWQRRTA